MAANVVIQDATSKRYSQLVNWLWELGCCWRCRHVIAGAQLEKENTSVSIKTPLTCETKDECRASAKRGWSTMPAPR